MAQRHESKLPDLVQMSQTIAEIAGKSQRIVNDFLARQASSGLFDMQSNAHLGKAFMDMTQKMMANPLALTQAQMDLWQSYLELWQKSARVFFGEQVEPVTTPAHDDRRFMHDDWQDHFLFDFIKQSYLLTAQWIQAQVAQVEGLDVHAQKKIAFYTRQFVDAVAPTNFAISNPEVLRATIDSGGENLLNGLSNLLDDLERGQGKLSIRMTDPDYFELGVDVAATPGKVIYQNTLMQLIQYQPSTAEVFQKPLLVVPPWINKYYILDLRPKNSLLKWWVEQGFSVFIISWVNPDKELAHKSFEDYMLEGTLAALDAIEQATGERHVNPVGYCLGGTLLAATTAYLMAKGDERLGACTFLTTLLDFAHPGEIEVFIDEEQLADMERRMNRRGYLEGSEMGTTFNMLRANDLIWSFFINNYLLGKEPFPFDLLYWNSDSTRMPATMHSFYLRNMYLNNVLKQPGGITLADRPIDLSLIGNPAYFLSTIDDHIAPWKSLYDGSRLLSGPVRFVMSGSGHIAGVVNSPAANKYCYWTNPERPDTPELWFEGATLQPGSWWPDWQEWISPYTGAKVPARAPGAGKLPVLEEAPGSYVKVRLVK